MDDDLEKRIRDLEGPSAQPADETEESTATSRLKRWIKVGWIPAAIVVLTLLANSRPTMERVVPGLREPAPEWTGLLVLAVPVVAVAIYVAVRLSKRRR